MADEKQQGFGDPFQEAEQNPLPVKQTLWERLNTGSGIPMVDEALKRDFTQKQAQANLYHQNAAQLNGLLMHLGTPKGKSYINPQTGAAYSEDDISQLKLQRDHAWGQYEKLVGVDKESKGALQKAKSIIDFMHGSRGRMAPPPTPEYQSSVSDAGVSTGGINAPRQGPVARPGDYATNISDVGGVQYDPSVAQKLTPPPLSPLQEAVRGSTQLPFATHQAKVQQFGLDTNALQSMGVQGRRALVKQMDMDETKPYIQDFILTGKITGNMAASLRPPPRPAGSYTTSVLDARSRASKGGEIFLDSHGNPIDLDNLDDSMGLKGMQVANQDTGKWEVRYEPYSPSQSTVTVGNEVYAVSPMDKSKLVTGAGAALGPHNVPSTSIHTAPGVTLGGEIGTVTTGTTKVPSTVGISGRTGSATPTGPVGRQGGISAPPTPQAPAATRKSGAASIPIASTAPRGKGNEQAIPFGAANQLNQRIIPVREAATQLFGDPSQPDFKGFQEYASLADDKNKDEREALANAVRLTLDHMKGEEKSAGSLTTLLGNYLGKPQALVDSETNVMRDTIGKLSPQNQEAYNSIMSVYGTVMGLRSLTRASSHQFSIEALEREIPLPGINAFSKQQFYDKMSRLAEQVYNGSKTVPLPKEEKDFYAGKVKEYRQLAVGGKGGMSTPPTPSGSAAAPKTSEEYLSKLGIKPKQP